MGNFRSARLITAYSPSSAFTIGNQEKSQPSRTGGKVEATRRKRELLIQSGTEWRRLAEGSDCAISRLSQPFLVTYTDQPHLREYFSAVQPNLRGLLSVWEAPELVPGGWVFLSSSLFANWKLSGNKVSHFLERGDDFRGRVIVVYFKFNVFSQYPYCGWTFTIWAKNIKCTVFMWDDSNTCTNLPDHTERTHLTFDLKKEFV